MFDIDPVVLAFLHSSDFLRVLYPTKALVCIVLLFITIRHLRELFKSHFKVIELSSHAKVTRFDAPVLHVGFIIYLGYILITTLITWRDFYQTV